MTALLGPATTATSVQPGEGSPARFLSAPTTYTPDGSPVARTWVWVAGGERFTLSCWEMALALANSGTQLHLDIPVGQVADLVVNGLRAVGGYANLAAMQRADQLNNHSEWTDQITVAQWRRTRTAWWPTGTRQESVARLLALTLSDAGREAMFTRVVDRSAHPACRGGVVQHVWRPA
jgi:hypothetical protein